MNDDTAARTPDQCQIPPHGWKCTRHTGHEGPCAAIIDEEASFTPLTDAIDAECDENENYPRGPYQMLCRKLERELAEKDAQIAEQAAQIVALREASERFIPFLPSRGEILDEASLNEGRTSEYGIAAGMLRNALSTPPPPVVGIEDVRPLVEALKIIAADPGASHGPDFLYDSGPIATGAIATFTAKHPSLA